MDVILLERIEKLGAIGDVVKVKNGYARNFLLPRGLAYEATEGNRKRIAAETRVRTTRGQAEQAEAQRFAATLGAVALTLSSKAGEEGRLFGSITAQDIADALAREGHEVDRRRIELEHPIKSLGDHTVSVRLHPEVHAELRVSVVPE